MLADLKAVGVLPLWWCDFSFWEARNVKGGGELMGLDMLILDYKGDLICELTAVKSIVSDPTQGKHRVMTGGLQLLPVMMIDVSLTLSLFRSQLSSSIVSQAPGRLLC
uniref:Uncharacterized protein n=1 Tax=Brassica oleracea var. oleracea TaxID=109376 RepID=A0A0D3AKP7_BRAOL